MDNKGNEELSTQLFDLETKMSVLENFVRWLADHHYADGLSKGMIIKKANEVLRRIY